MNKIRWNKIFNSIPLACAYACGGATVGMIFGDVAMYLGAIIAFIFTIYTNK